VAGQGSAAAKTVAPINHVNRFILPPRHQDADHRIVHARRDPVEAVGFRRAAAFVDPRTRVFARQIMVVGQARSRRDPQNP
jgi:hypothetical protein